LLSYCCSRATGRAPLEGFLWRDSLCIPGAARPCA